MEKIIIIVFILTTMWACSTTDGIKIIKNTEPFYSRNIHLGIRDRAEIMLPFTPASVRHYAIDTFSAVWNKDILLVKGIDTGEGKLVLYDKDKIMIGNITIHVHD